MKTLVVYYSLEGNTKCIAERMASEMDADLLELRTKEPIEATRFMDYYWGGDKGHPETEVELMPLLKDPADYDLIFIGSPVWAWAPAPPIYSFLKNNDLSGKKLAFFLTSEGDRGKAFARMKRMVPKSEVVAMKEFHSPMQRGKEVCSLWASEWAKSVSKNF